MKVSYTVYILISEKYKRTYVGQTNNLDDRLRRHNNGEVKSTKPYLPWRTVGYRNFTTRSEAMKYEKFLKSGKGREIIKEVIASA